MGIQGKLALWRGLALVAADENRLQGPDYDALEGRG